MSSYVDEDTARAVEAGRQTALGVFESFQRELKKVFLVFVAVFLAVILSLRLWVWDLLEANVKAQMGEDVAENTKIIATTPFDVILMQIKVGLILGAVAAIVVGLYLARKKIVARVEETVEVTAPRLYGFVAMALGLAALGIAYAYGVFFPLMFRVLAGQAFNAGVQPNYGIVHFTEFLLLLTLSFGLAAQLPLLMGALSFTEIVPYETFRDKWRYAVLGIFVFGAVFSPPDPFTQILWAIPLIALYAFSLGVAKVVTNVRRAGKRGSPVESRTFRRKGYQIAAAALLGFFGTAIGLATGVAVTLSERVLASLPDAVSLPMLGDVALPATIAQGGPLHWFAAGLQVGLLLGGIAIAIHLVDVLTMPVVPRERAAVSGDPEELDLRELDAAGVEAAPPEAFAALSEEEAVEIAGEAMEAGDEEKGKLVLRRWEEIDEADLATETDDADPDEIDLVEADLETVERAPPEVFAALSEEEAVDVAGEAMEAGDEEKGKLVLQRWEEVDPEDLEDDEDEADAGESDDPFEEGLLAGTTAGVLDAFTAEDRDDEEIGGYLYDVGFILDSLRSRMFVVFGLFISVFVGSFAYLYTIGIDQIISVFTTYVDNENFDPSQQVEGAADVLVALHPVEVLIFIVKFSGVLAFMVTLPVLLYYVWPAMQERRIAPGSGDRRGFLVWGGVLIGTTVLGSALGFFGFAPAVISYLINDAISSGMVIHYRVRSLLWIVFFMTIGIGLLVNVPVGMLLLHYMGLIRFGTFRRWWRQVVLGIFVLAMFATPSGVLTMVIFAIPLGLAFLFGLATLWVLAAPTDLARTVAKRIRAVGR